MSDKRQEVQEYTMKDILNNPKYKIWRQDNSCVQIQYGNKIALWDGIIQGSS